MISFFKKIPASAWFGCWLLSMVGLGSYASWDVLVFLMLAVGAYWYGQDAHARMLLLCTGCLGFVSAFMFSGAAYAALALALALCAAVCTKQGVGWFKSLAILFLFFIASLGIAFATFAAPQSAAFWLLAFMMVAWFFLDSLVLESGVHAGKGITALGALLVSQCAFLALFLPMGYLAQAFSITICLWFLSQAIELIEKRLSLKSFVAPVLSSGIAIWLMVLASYASTH